MDLPTLRKSFRRAVRFLIAHEKVLLAILAIIIVVSGGFWYRQFNSSHSDTPTVGGTFVEGVVADSKEMSQITTRLTKAGLLGFSDTGALQAQLAEKWSANGDQTEFRFTLLPGVDRSEITNVLAQRQDIIGDADVETDADRDIVIKLGEPNPSFPLLMTRPMFDYGPYRLGKSSSQTTVFSRNTRKDAVQAYINKIIIHSYTNGDDLTKALKDGRIDGAIGTSDLQLKNYQHIQVNLSRYYAVLFNTNKAPFRDAVMRKALATNAAVGSTPFTLIAADQEPYKTQATDIVAKWKSLGANVDLSLKPQAEVTGTIGQSRNFQALLIGIDYGSEWDPFYLWHSSQVRATGNNITGVNNDTVDAMVGQTRLALDPATRQHLLDDLHQTLTSQGVMMVVKQESLDYYVADKIHFIMPSLPSSNADRFLSVALWSVK